MAQICGRHDTYGSALSAQPGRPQGRSATNTSWQLTTAYPQSVLPVPAARMIAPYTRIRVWTQPDQSGSNPHPVYERDRTAAQGVQAATRRGPFCPRPRPGDFLGRCSPPARIVMRKVDRWKSLAWFPIPQTSCGSRSLTYLAIPEGLCISLSSSRSAAEGCR
jgi:hypothetical protein